MKRIAAHVRGLAGILAALAVLGSSGIGIAFAQGGYRIGPRDLVEVRVFEVPDLNVQRRVSEGGAINLPLIGDVAIAGQTEAEVSQSLKTLLESKYVQRASVDFKVLEFRSRPISVIGAVKQPGNLGFSGHWTVLEAITASGGLAENHGNVLYVLRRSDSGLADQIAIDLDDLLVRADPRVNVPLFANDLINIPTAVEVTIYCLGEVARPGALTFKSTERITLLAAISRAGGLTDRSSKRILIKRAATATAPASEIEADYKRILAGKAPDVELRQGDVIVVKESFF
ncbi:MAG: polysaccharide biosynthesis/export protein VpsN [Acidobacteriota bacterium]|jgi:polysaccharide export outer membrane protein|nr:polysaccharide biosynthesis/export protein VpsN [Acidobacteriota bacterium]